jgi:competence protein ComEA
VKVRTAGEAAVVDVSGAVRRPGVYRLPPGARVQDALRRAGGARHGADLQAVNLAAKVADGVQIVIPRRGGSGSSAPAGPTAAGAPAGPVNLNTATAEQLDTLDGVGPATAAKILAFRQQHGGFSSVSQLDQIPGIGPKKLAALRGKVTV